MKPQAVSWLALFLLLFACRSTEDPSSSEQGRIPDDDRPVVLGEARGLELLRWHTSDVEGRVTEVLDELVETEGGIEPAWWTTAEGQRWQRAGFRLIEFDGETLGAIRDALPAAFVDERRHVGIVPRWAELVRGAPMRNTLTTRTVDDLERLGPGSPRLIARCWLEPAPVRSGGIVASVRLQLAMQVISARSQRGLTTEQPRAVDALEQSETIDGLLLDASIHPDRIYLLTAAQGIGEPTTAGLGPGSGSTRSLGDRVLAGTAAQPENFHYRTIVILVGRGSSFTLLRGTESKP